MRKLKMKTICFIEKTLFHTDISLEILFLFRAMVPNLFYLKTIKLNTG